MNFCETDEGLRFWQPAPFRPPSWLRNGHLQTMLGALFAPRPHVPYRRERWDTPDGDFLDLDWVDGPPDSPVVVACHGLEGSSRSHYMLFLMDRLRRLGWRGVALNFRGCGGEPNRRLRSYHFGETGDLDWVLRRLDPHAVGAPVFLVGYSLGGNVVAKWLGEAGGRALESVRGACLCCMPFELAACQRNMDSGWNRMYTCGFLRTMKKKLRSKALVHGFDAKRALRAWKFLEFDDAATAPIHGFEGVQDYYARTSSRPSLRFIRVPTLVLGSLDDPFIPISSIPRESELGPEVLLRYVPRGGHIGFISRGLSFRWLDLQIAAWFDRLCGHAPAGDLCRETQNSKKLSFADF